MIYFVRRENSTLRAVYRITDDRSQGWSAIDGDGWIPVGSLPYVLYVEGIEGAREVKWATARKALTELGAEPDQLDNTETLAADIAGDLAALEPPLGL